MNNLTKQLKAKAKKLSDPIMDELKEQFEMSKSQRFFINLQTKSQENELCKMF
jgi:ribosomal protein L18E